MRSTPSSPCARSRTIAHASRIATTTAGIVQARSAASVFPAHVSPIPARSPATVIGSIARSTRWRARSIELIGGSVAARAGARGRRGAHRASLWQGSPRASRPDCPFRGAIGPTRIRSARPCGQDAMTDRRRRWLIR